jgi:hypothetical protein
MAVDTKSVQGRRTLQFTSLDEVVADAEKLVSSSNTRMIGNWPLERLLTHLATAINSSVDGFPARAPWFIRLFGPLLKKRFLTRTMSPGFQLPKDVEPTLYPPSAASNEALQILRAAVARVRNERMTASHPVLGKITHEEWTQLHLRHAELHLSYAIPG